MLTIRIRQEADVVILDLDGILDGGPQSRQVKDRVKEILQDGTRKIVLNLSAVEWANSLGIGVLIASFVSAKRAQAAVKFYGLNDRVRMVLKALDLIPDVFECFDSESDAVRSFSQPAAVQEGRS